MTQFYVYLHCKPNGDPFYVGKGDRKRSKQFTMRNFMHSNITAKYGRENINVFAFPCGSEQDAFDGEMQTIAQLRREGYTLANFTDGGEGGTGHTGPVHTDEAKESIRSKAIARSLTPDKIAARNVRLAIREQIAYELSLTADARKAERYAKQGADRRGGKMPAQSAEVRAKRAAARVGKTHSAETKAKMSSAHVGRVRGPQTPEHKAKLLESNAKGRLLRAAAKLALKCGDS